MQDVEFHSKIVGVTRDNRQSYISALKSGQELYNGLMDLDHP